ncbi:unnamed protein product [Arctogadus glacialis]
MQVSPAIRLSPVPGFPILPVPDYVPRLVLLDPRSPVFRPGFPILPVPDYVPRLVPLDPRSPDHQTGTHTPVKGPPTNKKQCKSGQKAMQHETEESTTRTAKKRKCSYNKEWETLSQDETSARRVW